jgi:hypothetical protein
VLYGTAALVVFNSGLCIVVDAGLNKLKNSLKKKLAAG